ncbi:MAG: hypothetical protein ACM336_13530 [Acidobacteriota bacterium]
MLALVLALAFAQEPESAASIMAKVAENQDRAEKARQGFVYQQTLLVRMRRGNRKLAREERSEFTVAPGPKGHEKKLTHFAGKYESKGKFYDYDHPHYEYKDVDIDGDVISDLADEMTSDSSRDGIGKDLFPLTAAEQKKYTFRLVGKETLRGKDVYRIAFEPKPEDGGAWKGEALVDAHEFQPVLVNTKFARRIPLWVKTVLGTDLKYLGFSVGYERFGEGVWFPVSYGGEFEVKAVFFYKRLITVSLANKGFRRTDVNSEITYGPEALSSQQLSPHPPDASAP